MNKFEKLGIVLLFVAVLMIDKTQPTNTIQNGIAIFSFAFGLMFFGLDDFWQALFSVK